MEGALRVGRQLLPQPVGICCMKPDKQTSNVSQREAAKQWRRLHGLTFHSHTQWRRWVLAGTLRIPRWQPPDRLPRQAPTLLDRIAGLRKGWESLLLPLVAALGRRRAVGIARGREGSGGGLGAAHGSHTGTADVDARESVRGSVSPLVASPFLRIQCGLCEGWALGGKGTWFCSFGRFLKLEYSVWPIKHD